MEIESVRCECCGLKEDCTQDYMNAVKAKFEGKWLCGLCSEAVRDEVSRSSKKQFGVDEAVRDEVSRSSKKQFGVDEAVKAHMSFCGKFKSNPAIQVADGMRQMLRRRSGDLSNTRNSPSSSSSKFSRSASTNLY